MSTTTAPAKKTRTRRLTKRQQAQVEQLYPMARAIGRSYQHRDADAMDRAHDFVLGVCRAVQYSRPGTGAIKAFARKIGGFEMRKRNDRYSLVRMPNKRYAEADEATRERNRGHCGFDAETLPAASEGDDGRHDVLEALRRLPPRDAEILERLHVREERLSDAARDLGVDPRLLLTMASLAAARLRNDPELCRSLGRPSFYEAIPAAPAEVPPNRAGMRPASAYLRRKGGPMDLAVMAQLDDGERPLAELANIVPERWEVLYDRMARLHRSGLARRTKADRRTIYSLTPKGRRLLDGVRRLEEWRAGRGASS